MTLTIKSLVHNLVDKEEFDLAKSILTLKQHPIYGEAFTSLFEMQDSSQLCKLLGNDTNDNYNAIKPLSPVRVNNNSKLKFEESLPRMTLQTSNMPNSSTEVYALKDFKDKSYSSNQNTNYSVDKETNEVNRIYNSLKLEHKMVLLTMAWASRPSTTSFIIKHCQRISCYFELDQDERWRTYYDNNRTKMQSLITNTISKYKKTGLIIETKMTTLNKHSVYHLSNQGLSVSRRIADEVGFSLDSSV